MKRQTVALLLHPVKTSILPGTIIREAMSTFLETLLSVHARYPQLRFNVAIPAYLLEPVDAMLMAKIRDLCKKSIIEVISTGYTEPFASLSPDDLTMRNVAHGVKVLEELTGQKPLGFLPAYSNWEPSLIEPLRAAGFRYSLVSSSLLAPEAKSRCGYWISENNGSSIGIVGTTTYSASKSGHQFMDHLKCQLDAVDASTTDPFAVVHVLLPVTAEGMKLACENFEAIAADLEQNLLSHQSVRIGDFLSSVNPIGMQYLPPSLLHWHAGETDHHFLNHLFSYDQIGFIQRKILDIYNRAHPHLSARGASVLLHELFFVQDISRLLPGADSGFTYENDRYVTYKRLISVDSRLRQLNKHEGARISITDFYRDGSKTILLSNKNCKIFVDPERGGQIIGFDYRARGVNLCCVYNPERRQLPDIIVSGASRTWFLDRITPLSSEVEKGAPDTDMSDLSAGHFNFNIRKNSNGTSVSLVRNASFLSEGKQSPLSIEKVFGISDELPELSFVYQLINPSLISCRFTFSVEFYCSLPGMRSGTVSVRSGRLNPVTALDARSSTEPCTEWRIDDRTAGVRLFMQTQKPLYMHAVPVVEESGNCQGLQIVLSTEVSLEPSAAFKLAGKIICKPIRPIPGAEDAF